ncbi:DNA-binding protein [Pseudomonas chlororaphis]|uniref:DNA-binding protein n=1 Tax=Pseudomonas chlororaphis TaxID=587753 RepID=UPI002366116A|nr:DNA-binding protein [Pseudomonas chlororaphis]WDH19933.1 DNA-binding protein [Pseudomonas chlororaphis]
MAVGVPEHEVFAAADAVLARGERPTVERVRLELGRGSPARVGALLDQWWEQLAGRLRGETRLPGLPSEVAQAFIAIWQQATTLAQGVVEQSFASQRQVLAEEREEVVALEARARLEIVQERQRTAVAVSARQGAETRLADLEQLLDQRQAQIDDLRAQREELQAQCNHVRTQLADVQQQLRDSREQAEQARAEQQRYTRDVEDRSYREIDRAREESKAVGLQLKDAQARLLADQRVLQEQQLSFADIRERAQAARADAQLLTAQLEQTRQQVSEAGEQISGLQCELQVARDDLVGARERAIAAEARTEVLAGRASRAPKKHG